MSKAFDIKDLGEKLKAKGLPVAEEALEEVYEAVKEWLLQGAAIQGGIVGGIVPVAVAAIDGFAKEQIDKIDGEPG
jgi:hypothetical protein